MRTRLDHPCILACKMRQYVLVVGMVKGWTAGPFPTDTGRARLQHAIARYKSHRDIVLYLL